MSVRSIVRAAGAVLVAAAAAFPLSAAKADGWYARGDVGASFSAHASGDIFNGTGFGQNFGTSPVADIAVGTTMPLSGFRLRGELEAAYRQSFGATHSAPNASGATILSTNTDIRNWTTMVNLYGDFDTGSNFTPYLGAGLGLGFNRLGDLTYSFNGTASATEPGTSKTTFAWSGMAGVGYKLSPSATLDLRYRYLDAGKISSSGMVTLLVNGTTVAQPPVTNRLKTHELTMGVRLEF